MPSALPFIELPPDFIGGQEFVGQLADDFQTTDFGQGDQRSRIDDDALSHAV
jgi:hypothetical protein